MKSTTLWIWLFFLGILLFWHIVVKPILTLLLLLAGVSPVVMHVLLLVLPLVLMLEVVTKVVMFQAALQPLKCIPTQVEDWPKLDRDTLDNYTAALESLGFERLTDYTAPSVNGMARLLVNPRRLCFAEVGQVEGVPMFCTISGALEGNWILGATNQSSSKTLNAISYAFLRQPQILAKRLKDSPVEELLQSFLDWRQQVVADLGANPVRLQTAEDYFALEQRKRSLQRQTLLWKSMSWCLVEMFVFLLNPRSEWLGKYAKFKSSGMR